MANSDLPEYDELRSYTTPISKVQKAREDMEELNWDLSASGIFESTDELKLGSQDPLAQYFPNPEGNKWNNLSDYPTNPTDYDEAALSISRYAITEAKRADIFNSVNFMTLGPAEFRQGEEDTEIPTATTNPQRPRTLAAAYSGKEMKLTVVFFDGTLYNYFAVSDDEWKDFKSSPSKGKYIIQTLNSKPRGPADMSGVSEEVQRVLQRIARYAQIANAKKSGFKTKPINRRRPKTPRTPLQANTSPQNRSTPFGT